MALEYSDFKCEAKDKNNNRIVKWTKQFMQDPAPYFAVVLDGPCVGTSTAFVKGGISEPNMIIAPQFNDKDAAEMEKQKMCKVVRSTLSDTIRYSEDPILEFVSIFNLDFMGSVFGRKRTGIQKPEVYPLSDFNDCLSKTKEKEVIISLTVSERMGGKSNKRKDLFRGKRRRLWQANTQGFFDSHCSLQSVPRPPREDRPVPAHQEVKDRLWHRLHVVLHILSPQRPTP